MKKTKYSESIVAAIKNCLTNNDQKYLFDEKTGAFVFGLRIRSKLKKISYIIYVHEEEYTVYAISPMGVNVDNHDTMCKMAEFICRANLGLRNGNFELDVNDGEIRYKTYVDCEGGVAPAEGVIENSIHCSAIMFDYYARGIIDVISGNIDAKNAVEKCENSLEETLRELFGDELDDFEGLDDLINESADSSEEKPECESTDFNHAHIKMDLFGSEGGVA